MEKERKAFQTLVNSTSFLKADTVKKKHARRGEKTEQRHAASHRYCSNYIFKVKTLL